MGARLFSIADARAAARRRLPRLIFDFVDGAAGEEQASRCNIDDFAAVKLLPRVLVNVERRDLNTTLLEREWSLPFGVAPMGMCNLSWPGADRMLSATARRHDIPHCVSTAASTSLEHTFALCGHRTWFQIYMGQSQERAMALVERADRTGIEVLVLTVDVPQVAPRRRDQRNGFRHPLRIRPRQALDFALHRAGAW